MFTATDWWWTLGEKYPLSRLFTEALHKKYSYTPDWSAESAYMQLACWARMVSEAGTFNPVEVIKTYEKGETIPSLVGDVHYRPQDHQCVRPVIIVRGKQQKDMQGKEDYYDVVEIVPPDKLMQAPDAFGCKLGEYT